MHAGNEYTDKPNDSQISFAHKAIDAGAELVIGSHPHVVQPVEKYKGKYIFYSLGNFVFDQMQSRDTKRGLAVKIIFNKEGVAKVSFYPVLIQDFSQPEFLEGSEATQVLSRLDYPLAENVGFEWDKTAHQFNKVGRSVIYNKKLSQSNVAKTEEEYVLENGLLKIVQGTKIIWRSSSEWWIDDFVLADSNNDGITDINLSVWKSGDYGSSKPFWVKENDMSIKNHFFVFDFAGGVMKPIWQSSNLDVPNCAFKITDVDDDGKNDLVVIEGDYSQKPICTGNHVAVWKWNDWGFSNEWRSENGKYRNLEIEHIGNKIQMVVDEF
jgi:poly-gamma-glutamate synthesis protein (capsule biosynthesis protein)